MLNIHFLLIQSMVIGLNFKKLIYRLIPIASIFIFSCQPRCENDKSLDLVTRDYINLIKELHSESKRVKIIKQSDFIVRVGIDSAHTDYKAYRISTSPVLLSKEELPNKIEEYKGFKIAFFTEKINNERQINMIKRDLEAKKFYQSGNKDVLSNYPEWVILEDNATKCSKLIKRANYRSTKELLEQNPQLAQE